MSQMMIRAKGTMPENAPVGEPSINGILAYCNYPLHTLRIKWSDKPTDTTEIHRYLEDVYQFTLEGIAPCNLLYVKHIYTEFSRVGAKFFYFQVLDWEHDREYMYDNEHWLDLHKPA